MIYEHGRVIDFYMSPTQVGRPRMAFLRRQWRRRASVSAMTNRRHAIRAPGFRRRRYSCVLAFAATTCLAAFAAGRGCHALAIRRMRQGNSTPSTTIRLLILELPARRS